MNIIATTDALHLSGIFIVTLIFLSFGFDLGFRIGSRQHALAVDGDRPYTEAIVAASLGLHAFMLAFSFNAVTSQYNQRKNLVSASHYRLFRMGAFASWKSAAA